MIPFFRKIRKKMADDNKPLRYMRYAIGEIVLVVIGILIALQINAWNTSSKNKEYENFYILGIINEIEIDLDNLKIMINRDSLKVQSGNYLLNHFKNPSLKKDSLLLKHFTNSILVSSFRPSDVIFEDMKFSGRLNFITNDTLRKKILDYYNYGDLIREALNINNDFSHEVYLNHLHSGEFDINSVLTPFKSKYGLNSEDLVEVTAFDTQFFYKPQEDNLVKEFIDRISMGILLSQLNVDRLKIGREKANNLISELKYYLK